MLLYSIYVCPLIVTEIIAKISQLKNVTFSQMTFRVISRLLTCLGVSCLQRIKCQSYTTQPVEACVNKDVQDQTASVEAV